MFRCVNMYRIALVNTAFHLPIIIGLGKAETETLKWGTCLY